MIGSHPILKLLICVIMFFFFFFFVAEYAGLPLIPPYLDPHNDFYDNGVNFASSGSGALAESHEGSVRITSSNL